MVAPLRISRDANCGHTCASSGTVSPSIPSTSLSVSAAPISTTPSVERPRSSGSRSTATTYDARRPRRLASTPQSVEPATTVASGCSASRASASARSAGRANPATRVAATAGAGPACRSASGSVGAGAPSAQAASLIGR